MQVSYGRIATAGVAGTAVMTMVGLWGAPMMGMPAMNPADMLAGAMGGLPVVGWMAHFMIGIVLAGGYALVAAWLPGPAAARGAVYGIAPWLMAQVAVMPMMGMPVFSGSVAMAMGSLVGHLVYGGIVGALVGIPRASR
jgi:uncharacterized membrane protein YagU involved in acid resistance